MKVVAPVLLGISATCSASLNAIVLYVFAKIGLKKLTFKDAFMLSMTVGDLMQSLLGYSLEIYFIAIRQIGKNNNDRELMFCKVRNFVSGIMHVLRTLIEKDLGNFERRITL